MYQNLIFVLLLAIISGCVSTKNIPITENSIPEKTKLRAIISKREKPDFAAMTAGKASFGLLGAVAMISAGNEVIKENEVEDPSHYIGAKLIDVLSTKYDIELINDGIEIIESTDIKEISEHYGAANYVLDVQTVNWSFVYFPTDWNNYRVIYSAKLRVIDTQKKEIIAEGFCSRTPEKDESSPSYDDLMENNAAGLKKELTVAADYCVEYFSKEVLTIKDK